MNVEKDIAQIIETLKITNELKLERATVLYRKLRLFSKENSKYEVARKKVFKLIEAYEDENWSNESAVDDEKIRESDYTEFLAEQERLFQNKQKSLIKRSIKKHGINQQQLGLLLGHKSKSYISELMNGVRPFSMKDLIVINRLFDIDLKYLIFTMIPHEDSVKIRKAIKKIDNKTLKLTPEQLVVPSC